MINSKKLIIQAISEIDSLSFEEIEKVIKKIDQEELMNNLVKDDYKNEILYYVDTKNHKDYIMKNNTLYYTEE